MNLQITFFLQATLFRANTKTGIQAKKASKNILFQPDIFMPTMAMLILAANNF